MDEERPKGAALVARLLIFVSMYFKTHPIYDIEINRKVKYDMFSLHHKDVGLVLYILLKASCPSEYQTRPLLRCCCVLLSSISQSADI